MEKECYYLVNSKILPSVYGGVLKAKALLAEGKAPNTSKAVQMAGISRSAFYKYKDYIFKYDGNDKNTVNLFAVLSDKAGVFSALTATLYRYGANILTVNQSIPVNGTADVRLTVKTDNIKLSLNELLTEIRKVNGIVSIKSL